MCSQSVVGENFSHTPSHHLVTGNLYWSSHRQSATRDRRAHSQQHCSVLTAHCRSSEEKYESSCARYELWGVRSSSLEGVDSITNRSDERLWQQWRIWDITDSQMERVWHFINTNHSYSRFSLSLTCFIMAITCYHNSTEYLESNAAPNLSEWLHWVICNHQDHHQLLSLI